MTELLVAIGSCAFGLAKSYAVVLDARRRWRDGTSK
jgi:hypothetical protein